MDAQIQAERSRREAAQQQVGGENWLVLVLFGLVGAGFVGLGLFGFGFVWFVWFVWVVWFWFVLV